jgi:hypothetical protein
MDELESFVKRKINTISNMPEKVRVKATLVVPRRRIVSKIFSIFSTPNTYN